MDVVVDTERELFLCRGYGVAPVAAHNISEPLCTVGHNGAEVVALCKDLLPVTGSLHKLQHSLRIYIPQLCKCQSV